MSSEASSAEPQSIGRLGLMSLAALGVPHDVKTYDAGHSFFSHVDGWQGWLARVPTPMAVGYDEQAAEDGWRRMLGFFDQHVR